MSPGGGDAPPQTPQTQSETEILTYCQASHTPTEGSADLVHGWFLKQLPKMPSIKAAKHPSVIKKGDYARLATELSGTSISAMTTRTRS